VSLAEASSSPTADFDVTIDAPADSTVLASGVQDGTHWTAEAVRDFAIAAGPFDVAKATAHAPDEIKVVMGVQDGVRIPAEDAAGRMARNLTALSQRYGPYPWPELHVVITRDVGRAGIEYPTMIFEGAARFALTASHEAAHQWFYSLVGNDQAREPFLDEALATWGAANVSGYMDFARSQVARAVELSNVGRPMTFWDQHQDSYGTGVYWRGFQALDALGSPGLVDCALRAYAAANAYGIATTQDLIDALSAVFPNAAEVLRPFGIPPPG
jgi:aminopeptidase N